MSEDELEKKVNYLRENNLVRPFIPPVTISWYVVDDDLVKILKNDTWWTIKWCLRRTAREWIINCMDFEEAINEVADALCKIEKELEVLFKSDICKKEVKDE